MINKSIIETKSKEFAIRIIRLYQFVHDTKYEGVMSKQVLRCGTSIGANVCEALCGISDRDFLSKMYIAFKECNETMYWLSLLHETDYISDVQYESISNDCIELRKILSSITKTVKEKLKES